VDTVKLTEKKEKTMRYLPHTDADIAAMLQTIGMSSMDELFEAIPPDCRRSETMRLPQPLTEWDLDRHMDSLADTTARAPEYLMFLGAGSYDHHIPEMNKQLLRRGELFTAYTPYQPEVSQGTLQAIFEFQTLTARLLGMEVANASMYDGASALAEALLMAIRITGRRAVAISTAINPLYRQVVRTYLHPTGYDIMELPYGPDGRTDLSRLDNLDQLAAVAVQSPNFFGCVEDLNALRSFGGPGLGMFTTRAKYTRNMPGRLVGQTVDAEGRRGFVLTLSTREQHIRREKATSNICTNQGLCATAAAMYMAVLGGTGIRRLARLNYDKAGYLRSELAKAGITLPFSAPVFNEFVMRLPDDSQERWQNLLERKIIAGLPLARFYPELADHYLLCATETCGKEEMDILIKEVSS